MPCVRSLSALWGCPNIIPLIPLIHLIHLIPLMHLIHLIHSTHAHHTLIVPHAPISVCVSWIEVDKILDVREEDVTEVVDEAPPRVTAGAHSRDTFSTFITFPHFFLLFFALHHSFLSFTAKEDIPSHPPYPLTHPSLSPSPSYLLYLGRTIAHTGAPSSSLLLTHIHLSPPHPYPLSKTGTHTHENSQSRTYEHIRTPSITHIRVRKFVNIREKVLEKTLTLSPHPSLP